MKIACEIEAALLQALIREVRGKLLPVRIQRGIPVIDENGSEQEPVIIETGTGFDFNAMMSQVINKHYNLKEP